MRFKITTTALAATVGMISGLLLFMFALGGLVLVLSIVALAQSKSDSARSSAIIGLALVVVAICLGMGRLIIGGGCL